MKKSWLVLACWLLGTVAYAQTVHAQTTTTTINPNEACFVAPDYTATDPGGIVLASFQLEVWAPGSDTTRVGPLLAGPDIPKTLATPDATTPGRYCLAASTWGTTIPKGPTYVATILSKGDGGSARSAVSNPFSFPLPVRAPLPVTGLTLLSK